MENDNQQRVKSFYRILEEGVAKLPADVRGALYRPCAVDCVKDDVLRELRRQFEECGRDLDRQYTKYGRSEYFFADIIEDEHLCQYAKGIDRDMLDEIVDLLVETVCSARKTIRIAGDEYPAELVKSKLMKLNSSHIEFVFDCISKNTTEIRNIKKYLLAVLFNAPSTINGYYTALVLKMGGKHYLTGPVILVRTNMDGEVISLTIDEVYLFQKYLASHSITLMADDQKLPCICME